ncbi:MAG: glycine--tRNA ligase subunit beta [Chloroflexia bacterium]
MNGNNIGFQEVILRLTEYWRQMGCIVWQPHNVQVGAGTSNPGTVLRVLGPERWNVAYLEPSARPADGRYGQNPNRWYEYYQFQVILKPDPGNPIDLYLSSLEAIGIEWRKHDVRFVEDNWQSPSLGAWGLGWEVWLDGLEITQYTYFQQACGHDLNPPCVEITYGLERIVMVLQGADNISEIAWSGDLTYGDLHLPDEKDYCAYNFDYASIDRLGQMYGLFEAEAQNALEHGLALPAHDYLLKCSHTFNVLDARGAVSVTQRAQYFSRMRDIATNVADLYLAQREALKFPFLERNVTRLAPPSQTLPAPSASRDTATNHAGHGPSSNDALVGTVQLPQPEYGELLVEIGVEELPPQDFNSAREQLKEIATRCFAEARLRYSGEIHVSGTPRRLVIYIGQLASIQDSAEQVIKGPPASVAFDSSGQPTQAMRAFAEAQGFAIDELLVRDFNHRSYLTGVLREAGLPTARILESVIPRIISELRFPMSMRWNDQGAAFSRPIRWLLVLFGSTTVPVKYAGVRAEGYTQVLRSAETQRLAVHSPGGYFEALIGQGVLVDPEERKEAISRQITALAAQVGGQPIEDERLLDEVTNLVEAPNVILGNFDPAFLSLPSELLITVMTRHQRYFPVTDGVSLLPHFVVVANGKVDTDLVRAGNEQVLRARFADARFFFSTDTRQPLASFVPKLAGLTFHDQLGSYLKKQERLYLLAGRLVERLPIGQAERALTLRAAELAKADLVTSLVTEFTSLQGTIGYYYALLSGEEPQVAQAIKEQYLPRFADDRLPQGWPSTVLALADRLDNLISIFAVGGSPTGAADPYGMRRAALGVIQILVDADLDLSLSFLVGSAAALVEQASAQTEETVLNFVRRRLEVWLQDEGYRADLVRAVLVEQWDEPARANRSIKTLAQWAERTDFKLLVKAYMRVFPLVQKNTGGRLDGIDMETDAASYRLYQVYMQARGPESVGNDVDQLMQILLALAAPVDSFLDDTLVLHKDEAIRSARLGVLRQITELPRGIVDITRIAT